MGKFLGKEIFDLIFTRFFLFLPVFTQRVLIWSLQTPKSERFPRRKEKAARLPTVTVLCCYSELLMNIPTASKPSSQIWPGYLPKSFIRCVPHLIEIFWTYFSDYRLHFAPHILYGIKIRAVGRHIFYVNRTSTKFINIEAVFMNWQIIHHYNRSRFKLGKK